MRLLTRPLVSVSKTKAFIGSLLVLLYPLTQCLRNRRLAYRTSMLKKDTLVFSVVKLNAHIDAFHIIGQAGGYLPAANVARVGYDFHAHTAVTLAS